VQFVSQTVRLDRQVLFERNKSFACMHVQYIVCTVDEGRAFCKQATTLENRCSKKMLWLA